jgi:hypothetical protein
MTAPVCYLIHLETKLGSDHPNGSAGHYLGTTVNLDQRLACHREGRGGRDVERRLKAQRNAPRMCPRCS